MTRLCRRANYIFGETVINGVELITPADDDETTMLWVGGEMINV